MDNYSTYTDNYAMSLDSAGTAQRKFNIYQENTQAHLERMTAAWQNLGKALIDSNVIKTVIDFGTALAQFVPQLLLAVGAIITFTKLYKIFAITISTPVAIQNATLAIAGLTGSIGAATVAITALSTVGIMALVTAIGFAFVKISDMVQKNQEWKTSIQDVIDAKEKLASATDDTGDDENYAQFKDAAKKRIALIDEELKIKQKKLDEYYASGATRLAKEQADQMYVLLKEKDGLEKQIAGTDELAKSKQGLAKTYDDIRAKQTEAIPEMENETEKAERLKEEIKDLTSSYKEHTSSIKEYQSEMKTMVDIYDKINDGGKISNENLIDLLLQYPEYNAQIKAAIGNKDTELSLTEMLFEANKKKAIQEQQDAIRDIKNLAIKNGLNVDAYILAKKYLDLQDYSGKTTSDFSKGNPQLQGFLDNINTSLALIDSINSVGPISAFNIDDTKAKKETQSSLNDLVKDRAIHEAEIAEAELVSKEATIIAYENFQKCLSTIKQTLTKETDRAVIAKEIAEIEQKQVALNKEITEEKEKQREELFKTKEAERDRQQAEFEGQKDFLENQKKILEDQYDLQIKGLEESKRISLEKFDEEIYQLEQTSEAQKRKNDLVEREVELNKKLIDLAKAQEALENAKKERNTKMLTANGWEWIANPKAVREAQENLDKINQDIADDKAKNAQADQEYANNSLIAAKQREKDLASNAWDAEIRTNESAKTAVGTNIDNQIAANNTAANIAMMKANSELWKIGTVAEKSDLAAKNAVLGYGMGWTIEKGVWKKPDGTPAYSEGGVNTTTGPAMLHGTKAEPEVVLNNTQAGDLYTLIKNIPHMQLGTNSSSSFSSGGYTFSGPIYVTANNADQFVESMRQYTRLTRK